MVAITSNKIANNIMLIPKKVWHFICYSNIRNKQSFKKKKKKKSLDFKNSIALTSYTMYEKHNPQEKTIKGLKLKHVYS